jgi:hypothetical protein
MPKNRPAQIRLSDGDQTVHIATFSVDKSGTLYLDQYNEHGDFDCIAIFAHGEWKRVVYLDGGEKSHA